MAFRLLLCLSIVSACAATESLLAQPAPDSNPELRSFVQGRGSGSVKLTPTHIRISIPIKLTEETSWDATQKLRKVREEVVDRAIEMGAVEGSLRSVGFQCVDTTNQSSTLVAGLNRGDPLDSKFMATCYVVADFQIRKLEDNEAMIAMSQSQLEELFALIPKQQSKSRSYSYTTLSSGLNTQQMDSPLALFYAAVSKEDQSKAFKTALENARQDLRIALDALSIDAKVAMSIHQSSVFSSSRYSHPVEAAIFRDDESIALSLYPDAVIHTVRLNVSAYFQSPE